MKYSPVIVVVAFNRPRSLERLLYSLSRAQNITNAKLIISIDNKEPENFPVRDIANNFHWPFGEKQVIYQPKRLGLQKHILTCGDLSNEYGSVIILEDDLFVSPYFYDYACHALEYYEDDDRIGGISLYNHTYEDLNDWPFQPIQDDSDVYFMQFPSSLGQTWTKKQWQNFRKWFEVQDGISRIRIHRHIKSWPETSWKKYFAAFLVDTNRFFSFPVKSFTANFNDQGTHKSSPVNFSGQAALRLYSEPYRFKPLKDSYAVYDSYFELMPEKVKAFNPGLEEYDFIMDIYGEKELEQFDAPFVITSRPARKVIKGFGRALKPHEMNILYDLKGEDIVLCRREDVLPFPVAYKKELKNYFYYYSYRLLGKKAYIYNYFKDKKILSKFFN